MKRFFTFAICLLSLQIVQANDDVLPTTADTTLAVNLVAPLNPYANSITKLRLDSIQKDVQLDYNEYVQGYIDIYTRHKDEMSQVLGLSKYYFPMYEKIFREAGIPPEIKYLSIVESKLDPNAVSRVGATGPWQFMATTAKIYGLNMDGYVDERKDPIQSCYAAAAYLKDAYQEFGDWLVAIASYNCGKSNVERAIAKSGAIDFWSIRQYLPTETRGYVPAFIAMSYVMNYAGKHNINAQAWSLSAKTDTVMVDKYISLSNIAKALNIDNRELALFNPSYKRQIINGTAAAPRRLVIPNNGQINYAVLYEALNNPDVPVAQATIAYTAVAKQPAEVSEQNFHKVKRGETLVDIASTYGIDLRELKTWNHLRTNKPVVGQVLKLNPGVSVPDTSAVKKLSFITYKVKAGDTLGAIADKFDGATVENIRSLNGLKKGALQPGMKLKISRG
jgi:membrane-bound lytic murein transglycosylase D